MHARTRTLVAAALGTMLLGGCATLDSLLGNKEPRPDAASVPDGPAAAEPEVIEDPAADLPIARPGRPIMRQVQAALNERGLNAGPADGYSGPRTVRAIRLFKVARRMEVNESITPRLLAELGLTQS